MTEDKLQAKCFQTANKLIPETRGLLYSVPNGAYLKDKTQAMKLIATGMTPGISDIILDIPNEKYHGLKLELKLKGQNQSQHQINYQNKVTSYGYHYVVIYTLSHFLDTITNYLSIPSISVSEKDDIEYNLY